MELNKVLGISKHNMQSSDKTNNREEIISFNDVYKPTINSQEQFSRNDVSSPSCQDNLRCYFCDFCHNTSIHGFNFLGERRRYIIEKIWWFTVVTLAFTGSGFLISNSYSKWAKAPVLITFSTTETPVWKIPFPAVTICPEIKVNNSILNYSDVLSKVLHRQEITEKESDLFSFFQMLCDDFDLDVANEYNLNITETIDADDLEGYLKAFASMEFDNCKWMGSKRDCDDVLTHIYTFDGKCRTFNMLDSFEIYVEPEEYYGKSSVNKTIKKWSLEEGYPSNSDLDTYPLRTIRSGVQGGFHIELNVLEKDMDYGCGQLQGFKVTLHHPAEEPDLSKNFRVPLDEAVFVSVKPRMMTTADDIGSYKPTERHCYLTREKTLRMFKIYTQQNCMSECLTNYTRNMCNCVAFHMADLGETEICTLKSKDCMERAKVSFLLNDVIFARHANAEDDEDITEQCDCLPACTSIEFEAETSQTTYDWKKTFKALVKDKKGLNEIEGQHYSKLVVYYKDMQFMTSERHELYGTVDFLANCGGLLGLFCGFSFTSSMEILYYLTLRFVCNLKKFGQKIWSGASELT